DEFVKGIALLVEFLCDFRENPVRDTGLKLVHVTPASSAPRSPMTGGVVRLKRGENLVGPKRNDFGNVHLDFAAAGQRGLKHEAVLFGHFGKLFAVLLKFATKGSKLALRDLPALEAGHNAPACLDNREHVVKNSRYAALNDLLRSRQARLSGQ